MFIESLSSALKFMDTTLNRKLAIILTICLSFALSFGLREMLIKEKVEAKTESKLEAKIKEKPQPYQRIASFSPALTEILFALNLGEQVIAVTSYCKYPDQVLDKDRYPNIGTLFDTKFEKLAKLKPDLVILEKTSVNQQSKLDDMGLNSLNVELKRLDQITKVIAQIAQKTGQSDQLAKSLNQQRQEIIKEHRSKKDLSVLIMVDANFIAGANTMYHEMIKDLNCENAYKGNIPYPQLSAEGLIHMNPDVIIQLEPELGNDLEKQSAIINKWHQKKQLNAVKKNQVYVLAKPYVSIPGPRFILTMRDIASCVEKARAVYE